MKNKISKILEKAFPGLEVVDAKTPVHLFPTQEDFDRAIARDPEHCGFANCAARICGSTRAHFFQGFVYIDMFGEDGIRRVYRFRTSVNIYRTLEAFDEERPYNLSKAFILRPPAASFTLKATRKRSKKYRASDVGKAVAAEHKARSYLSAATRENERAKESLRDARAEERPGSPKMKEVVKRVESSKRELVKARQQLDSKIERAARLRQFSYAPGGKPKPRHKDINVRNGSGWFTRMAAAAESQP